MIGLPPRVALDGAEVYHEAESTSEAKALRGKKNSIAALKRCATQIDFFGEL